MPALAKTPPTDTAPHTADGLIRHWLDMLAELSDAAGTGAEQLDKIRLARVEAVLADPEPRELRLVELLVLDVNMGPFLLGDLTDRLRREPIKPMSPTEERILYEVQASAGVQSYRVQRKTEGLLGLVRRTEDRPVNVSQLAGRTWDLARRMRVRRAELAAAAAQHAAGEPAFRATLAAARAELERTGDWHGLVLGSPVVRAWLHGPHYLPWAVRFSQSPDSLRDHLLRMAAEEGR